MFYGCAFYTLLIIYDLCIDFFVFFFKQKTAYEMRISDWSSDVCSSDLHHCFGDHVIGNCKAAPNPEVRLTGSQGVELARRYDLDVNPVVTMKVCQARHQPGGSEAVRGGDLQQIGRASCRERVCQYV